MRGWLQGPNCVTQGSEACWGAPTCVLTSEVESRGPRGITLAAAKGVVRSRRRTAHAASAWQPCPRTHANMYTQRHAHARAPAPIIITRWRRPPSQRLRPPGTAAAQRPRRPCTAPDASVCVNVVWRFRRARHAPTGAPLQRAKHTEQAAHQLFAPPPPPTHTRARARATHPPTTHLAGVVARERGQLHLVRRQAAVHGLAEHLDQRRDAVRHLRPCALRGECVCAP
jgi:hypothetical protein